MTSEEARLLLRRMQEPEPYEPQITELAFEALEIAISALEELKALSPVENKCCWIPCEERLPDTEERGLCCTRTKKGSTGE